MTTSFERESLEAHVDLCAVRYSQLDQRLSTVEDKVDQLNKTILDSSNSMRSVVITSASTIVASVVGMIVLILMKF
jgi:hypothetical protein